MARIAVGGFQHETNTFAPSKATYAMFEQGGGWPAACFGNSILDAVAGANIPLQGAIQTLREQNHQLVGTAYAAASPSAHVTDDAFERIVTAILAGIDAAGRVDGVYLDLHGAMVTESYDDGEGELLRRVRQLVGPRVPIVASLDLHCNCSSTMIEMADALVAYRTYPHVDMAETGARAAIVLHQMLLQGKRLHKEFKRLDYLTPLSSQSTFIEPGASLYKDLARIEAKHNCVMSFTPGFPMADIADCGMAVFAMGEDAHQTRNAVLEMTTLLQAAEALFHSELLEPDAAVSRAMLSGKVGKPTVIADTQDNPGAGGNGDTTGMLAALLRQRAQDACLGMLVCPQTAALAHATGIGHMARFRIGEWSGVPGTKPLESEFVVEQLGTGIFTCTGKMFTGYRMRLGPMALLRSVEAPGVRVVIGTHKCQAADQDMFRHVGLEPASQRLLVLKSSVHFRADFQPIATEVLIAKAPGPAQADPSAFAWTKLRKGLRLMPLGRAFT